MPEQPRNEYKEFSKTCDDLKHAFWQQIEPPLVKMLMVINEGLFKLNQKLKKRK